MMEHLSFDPLRTPSWAMLERPLAGHDLARRCDAGRRAGTGA